PLVALEAALLVEDWFAADAQVPDLSVRRDSAHFEIAERLARREHGLVVGPRADQRRHVIELPAFLAERRCSRIAAQVGGLGLTIGEAQSLVLFPEPVGRKLGQAAEAGFAVMQCIEGGFAVGNVAKRGINQAPALIFDGSETRLDREAGSILAPDLDFS